MFFFHCHSQVGLLLSSGDNLNPWFHWMVRILILKPMRMKKIINQPTIPNQPTNQPWMFIDVYILKIYGFSSMCLIPSSSHPRFFTSPPEFHSVPFSSHPSRQGNLRFMPEMIYLITWILLRSDPINPVDPVSGMSGMSGLPSGQPSWIPWLFTNRLYPIENHYF